MSKRKKQFRLFDVYRQSFTGIASEIKGIITYKVTKTLFGITTIHIKFEAGWEEDYNGHTEQDIKDIVRNVNKELKNCMKPGRKAKC